MRVIVIATGTAGDALPMIGLGAMLKQRGHEVLYLGNGAFRDWAVAEGLTTVDVISAEEHQRRIEARKQWRGAEGFKAGARNIVADMRAVDSLLALHVIPNATVMVAQGLMLGARVARDTLHAPLATIHLQPMCFRAIHDPATWPSWFPSLAIKGIYRLIDSLIDKELAPAVNSLLAEKGLPPVRGIMGSWWHSPDLTLGLFPDWLVQPDALWPPNAMLTGFPLNATGVGSLSPDVEDFLDGGEPPIVFGQSSAVRSTKGYFESAVDIARTLGRRAVLLAPDGFVVTGEDVLSIRSAPHALLLPRAALLVHQGGIGTCAAAVRAGIPQFLVPQILDQPDNLKRFAFHGLADGVAPKRFRPSVVCKRLEKLLAPSARQRCQDFALKCEPGEARAVAAIEDLARRADVK